MVWFWVHGNRDDTLPSAEFRRTRIAGEVTASKVVHHPGRLPDQGIPPMFELTGPNKKRVDNIVRLPTTTACPLVAQPVQEVLLETLPSNQLQLLKTHIIWNERLIEDFSFARPLHLLDCIDIERSKINRWDLEGDLFSDYERLVMKPDCLSGLGYARANYLYWVLVSDAVKEALDKVNDGTLLFVRPEDMVPWYREA